MGSVTIWLVQPVSPALDHDALAPKLGFSSVMAAIGPGFLDEGRLVLVMGPPFEDDEAAVAAALDDSKWVAGYRMERWDESTDGYPFGLPGFRLINRTALGREGPAARPEAAPGGAQSTHA